MLRQQRQQKSQGMTSSPLQGADIAAGLSRSDWSLSHTADKLNLWEIRFRGYRQTESSFISTSILRWQIQNIGVASQSRVSFGRKGAALRFLVDTG